MNILFRLCTFIIVLMPAEQASASEWEKILDREKDTVYVDLDSYATTGGYPSILIKSMPKQTSHTAERNAAKSSVQIDRFQFDCIQHWVRKITRNNEPLDSRKNLMMQFRPITPKTLEQEIETLVCQVSKMVGDLHAP